MESKIRVEIQIVTEEEESFSTSMQVLPRVGDKINIYRDYSNDIFEVTKIIHYFIGASGTLTNSSIPKIEVKRSVS